MKHSDTIAAIATPLGVGGVGIIRVSGKGSLALLQQLFSPSNGDKAESHRMIHGWLAEPESGQKIDEILACYMKSPKSYTGEDIVEFYCHGGMAVLQRALKALISAGARQAQKGEFTKRAFLNGRLDLAQAEAVLDLIKAGTEVGAGYAVGQLEGRLSRVIAGLRAMLVSAQAELEAAIDFSDDLPDFDGRSLAARLLQISQDMAGLIRSASGGRLFRQGLAMAIVGKPNVGKSSLLNALLGEDRALVAGTPGTTRDTIIESIDLNGLPVRLIDTAGLRKAEDGVEKLGVERTSREIDSADVVLVMVDASSGLDSLDKEVIHRTAGARGVIVLNKIDLGLKANLGSLSDEIKGWPVFQTSALYGQGINELKAGIFSYVSSWAEIKGKDYIMVNARHRECLVRANEALARAQQAYLDGMAV
ncbi:MAG: tRNA uridine-5-carboxymethylaminomethyl(34) synthesis GTPase MnmE, partial [Candidatus Margulisbacteria bacterium]|nr:tRNA uridine-5-carboxymethylaminomethyl(34) synthesis GTPase MnmE [Candidatus Margulisiibacteriota bacterium]